jgi:hypothetical protein
MAYCISVLPTMEALKVQTGYLNVRQRFDYREGKWPVPCYSPPDSSVFKPRPPTKIFRIFKRKLVPVFIKWSTSLTKEVRRRLTKLDLRYSRRRVWRVLWVLAKCNPIEVYQRFRGVCCLHQDIRLMNKASGTSEMTINFYQTTRRYNPEDSHLREVWKSYAPHRRNKWWAGVVWRNWSSRIIQKWHGTRKWLFVTSLKTSVLY